MSTREAIDALYATGHWLLSQDRNVHAACVFRAMMIGAPGDERGWLALGACHEKIGQLDIALELYSAATFAAKPAPRCAIARARVLRALERDELAESAYDAAAEIVDGIGDEELASVIAAERSGSWSPQ